MAKKLTATTRGIRRKTQKRSARYAAATLPKNLAQDPAAKMLLRSLNVHQRRAGGKVDASALTDVLRQSKAHGRRGGDFVMHMVNTCDFHEDASGAADMIRRAESVVKEEKVLGFDALKDLVARGRGEKTELDDTGCEALKFIGERHEEAIVDPRVRTFFQDFGVAFQIDVIQSQAMESYLENEREIAKADALREEDYEKADLLKEEIARSELIQAESSNFNRTIQNVAARRDAFVDKEEHVETRDDAEGVRSVMEAPLNTEGETQDVIGQVRNERDDANDARVRYNAGENVQIADEDL